MSYNALAPANQLVTILTGLSGMGAAQLGMPLSIGPRVTSYVTMGSQASSVKAAGVKQRTTRYFVVMAYRLDDAESTAESTLMSLVDAFMQAIHDDKTLAGTVYNAEVNSLAADEPDYQLRAGKEFREYPLVVEVVQRAAYEVNP